MKKEIEDLHEEYKTEISKLSVEEITEMIYNISHNLTTNMFKMSKNDGKKEFQKIIDIVKNAPPELLPHIYFKLYNSVLDAHMLTSIEQMQRENFYKTLIFNTTLYDATMLKICRNNLQLYIINNNDENLKTAKVIIEMLLEDMKFRFDIQSSQVNKILEKLENDKSKIDNKFRYNNIQQDIDNMDSNFKSILKSDIQSIQKGTFFKKKNGLYTIPEDFKKISL